MDSKHQELIRRAEANLTESLKTLIELRIEVGVREVSQELYATAARIADAAGVALPPGSPLPPGSCCPSADAAYRPSMPGRLPSFRPEGRRQGTGDA